MMIKRPAARRAGLELTPDQFRHLQAKVLLDDQPGAFELVKQSLGHKNEKTTVNSYAGINSRRAARHHHRLIDRVLNTPEVPRRRRSTKRKRDGSEG
jgi:integrase